MIFLDIQNQKTHEAKHNENLMHVLLQLFRNARLQLVRKLEQLSEEQVARSSLHPRLNKPMRVID